MINRTMSRQTWKELDDVIFKIRDKAAADKNDEVYGYADHANALMRQLATELWLEDESLNQPESK